jgi:transcriptional regulator with XRE-family HTH domain
MADVTARDLANMLGISTAAVSMALNGKPGVSSETRTKVLAAATKLGYVTPKSRQSERQAKNIVSFVIYVGVGVAEQTTFSTFVMRGAEAAQRRWAIASSFTISMPISLGTTRSSASFSDYMRRGYARNGHHAAQRDAFLHFYALGNVPLVIIDNFCFPPMWTALENDNTYA